MAAIGERLLSAEQQPLVKFGRLAVCGRVLPDTFRRKMLNIVRRLPWSAAA
jgi:hypothetical protein